MKAFKTAVLALLTTALVAGCISPELRTTRIAMNERDYDRALASADAELARMPGSPEPLFIKGQIYEIRSDWKAMTFWYDSCLAVSKVFEGRIRESKQRISRRFLSQAYYTFKDTAWVRENPNAPDSILQHRRDSLAVVALEHLEEAAIVSDTSRIIYEQGTLMAYQALRYDDAIIWAGRAIAHEKPESKDIDAREILVMVYQQKQDYPNVIKWSRELIDLADPATDTTNIYLKALDALIEAQETTKDYEGALLTLQEAVKRFPNRNDIKMNIALFFLKINKFDQAKDIYLEVLKAEPSNFVAALNLGTLLANEEKWKECIPYLIKALETEPNNITALTNLMAAYYNDKQDAKGAEIKKRLDALGAGN